MELGLNASGFCWSVPPSGVSGKLRGLVGGFEPAVLRAPGGTLGNYARLGVKYAEFYGTPAVDEDGLVNEDLLEYAVNDAAYERRWGVVSTRFFDFYMDLLKATGAQALWVASMKDLVDLEAALKRLKNAGIGVRGVEAGNEQFLLKYGADVNEYIAGCALIKAVCVKYGVPMSMCVKVGGGNRLKAWNTAVMGAGLADAYAVHMYQDDQTSLELLASQYQAMASLNRGAKFWGSEVGSQRAVVDMGDLTRGFGILSADEQMELVCFHNMMGDGDHGLIKESRGWFGGSNYALTGYGRDIRKLMVG